MLVGSGPNTKHIGIKKHHWYYSKIQQRIKLWADELSVLVHWINPQYTSITCGCGSIDTIRFGKYNQSLKCNACGEVSNANMNAARNIRIRGEREINTNFLYSHLLTKNSIIYNNI